MFEFRSSKELKKRKVKIHFREEIEPQEVLLDSLVQKKEIELGITEKKIEVPLPQGSLNLFSIFIFFLISVIFFRTFQFQVVEGKKFLELAQKNRFIFNQIKAERGIIYDQNFKQLVFNLPSFDLVCQKESLPKDESERLRILKEISQIVKLELEELKGKIEKNDKSTISIKENIDLQTLIILETKAKELPGFETINNTVQDYFSGPTFSQIIGYKRKSGEGAGLEEFYDEILKEKAGRILVERDAKGNLLSQKIVQQPASGNSLVLWLDSELQKKSEELLKIRLKELGAEVGVVVVLDPKTAGVLALVSLPAYDNNFFSRGMTAKEWKKLQEDPLNPLFNWAVAGAYPTGSVIKPLIALAALEENIISPQKEINCQGKISIVSPWNPQISWEFGDWKTHGRTDLKKAIAESCNVYFYYLGGGDHDKKGLGPTRIRDYLSLFGWGQKTGIDLPQETEGFLPDPQWKKEKLGEAWYDGDTYNFSIGQGYLRVTPLQMATSFLPLANSGKLLKPSFVQKIIDTSTGTSGEPQSNSSVSTLSKIEWVDSEKNLFEEIKPKLVREDFIEKENLEIVRQGMRQAVTQGTATGWLDQLPVSVAAKTGTAQTGKKGFLDSWIVVFAPYENPEIVLTVMIKDVKEGQVTVLPVAKAILEWYFSQR